jgi:hypothetical protein
LPLPGRTPHRIPLLNVERATRKQIRIPDVIAMRMRKSDMCESTGLEAKLGELRPERLAQRVARRNFTALETLRHARNGIVYAGISQHESVHVLDHIAVRAESAGIPRVDPRRPA